MFRTSTLHVDLLWMHHACGAHVAFPPKEVNTRASPLLFIGDSCNRSSRHGNPSMTACFLDESYNGVVAAIARSSHAGNFEVTVFAKFGLLQGTGVNALPKRRRRRGGRTRREE